MFQIKNLKTTTFNFQNTSKIICKNNKNFIVGVNNNISKNFSFKTKPSKDVKQQLQDYLDMPFKYTLNFKKSNLHIPITNDLYSTGSVTYKFCDKKSKENKSDTSKIENVSGKDSSEDFREITFRKVMAGMRAIYHKATPEIKEQSYINALALMKLGQENVTLGIRHDSCVSFKSFIRENNLPIDCILDKCMRPMFDIFIGIENPTDEQLIQYSCFLNEIEILLNKNVTSLEALHKSFGVLQDDLGLIKKNSALSEKIGMVSLGLAVGGLGAAYYEINNRNPFVSDETIGIASSLIADNSHRLAEVVMFIVNNGPL